MLRLALILVVLAVGLAPSHVFAACSNPTAAEGDIMYNSTSHVLQFCNNSNVWISMVGTTLGETDPKIGTLTSPMPCTTDGSTVNCNAGIDLSSQVTGNLGTARLNSGTSASSSTMWRGDGTWGTFTESDPQVGTLMGGLMCKANGGGTAVDCNYDTSLIGWWQLEEGSGTTTACCTCGWRSNSFSTSPG